MIDVVEILIHWYAGRSQSELSTSLGVDRKTARKYLVPAVAAGLMPGGPPMSEQDWRRLVCEWFPELVDSRLRQVSWPVIEAHRDYIAAQLKAGVTAATIHQRLVDEHGLEVSVASLRRWVRANLPEDARRGAVTVLRDNPPPGEEAQIDYGQLGMWLDPRIEDLRPHLLDNVLAHISTGDDERLAQGELFWTAVTLIPWLLEQLADPLLQRVELLSVQS